jgi:hypothetical protein
MIMCTVRHVLMGIIIRQMRHVLLGVISTCLRISGSISVRIVIVIVGIVPVRMILHASTVGMGLIFCPTPLGDIAWVLVPVRGM